MKRRLGSILLAAAMALGHCSPALAEDMSAVSAEAAGVSAEADWNVGTEETLSDAEAADYSETDADMEILKAAGDASAGSDTAGSDTEEIGDSEAAIIADVASEDELSIEDAVVIEEEIQDENQASGADPAPEEEQTPETEQIADEDGLTVDSIALYTDADYEYTVFYAEIGTELTYLGTYDLTVEYECDEECYVCGEIWSDSDEPALLLSGRVKSQAGESSQLIGMPEKDMPEYYTIKAYLTDVETGEIISNTYENPLHTKSFCSLTYNPDDEEEGRAVSFSGGNYGVFAEDTVLVYGDSSVNTWDEPGTDGTYTFRNVDEQMEDVTAGCNLAYYYDEELRLLAAVTEVTKSSQSVTISTEAPALDEVFEELKIDISASEMERMDCTVDTSGLMEGITYSESDEVVEISSSAEENIAYAEEQAFYASSDFAETRADLSLSQKYSFNAVNIGNASLSGSVLVKMDFPMKLYISGSKQYFQCDINASLYGDVSVSGKAECSIPLGEYYAPIIYDLLYIRVQPSMVLSASGALSLSVSSIGSVSMQTDPANGLQVLSKSFKADSPKITTAGTVFCGVELSPELMLFPSMRLMTASLKFGPQMTAATTDPIPEIQQKKGDHSCQSCISGAGNVVGELKTAVTVFKKEVSSTKTFRFKGFEWYYSIDEGKGGRGKCPYVRDEEYSEEDVQYYDASWSATVVIDNIKFHVIKPSSTRYAYINSIKTDQPITQLTVPFSITDIKDKIEISTFYYNGNRDKDAIEYLKDSYEIKAVDCSWLNIDCSSVSEITFESGIEEIEMKIKYDSLNSMNLSDTLKSLDIELNGCPLESIALPSSLESLHLVTDGCLLESITIPGAVEELRVKSDSIESVTISEGVDRISNYTFRDCISLEQVSIPGTVTSIGDHAFAGCNLKNVTVPGSVTSIGICAFGGNESLESITLPDSVASIGSSAFFGCGSLRSIVIPDKVTSIEYSTFSGCGKLESVRLPAGVKYIGEGTFYYCSSLKEVNLPEGLITIGEDAFAYSGLTEINFPESLQYIYPWAFEYCTDLEQVTFSEGLRYIYKLAFMGCTGLTDVTLPASLERIDYGAFLSCTGLKSVTILSNKCKNEYGVFEECENLTDATIEIMLNPYDIPNLKHLTLTGETSLSNLFAYTNGWAMDGLISLESIVLSEGIYLLEDNTFEECINLTQIYIPESVVSFGDSLFADPSILTIYGVSGSAAERYAAWNNIRFVAVDSAGIPEDPGATDPSETPETPDPTDPSETPETSDPTDPSETPETSDPTDPSETPETPDPMVPSETPDPVNPSVTPGGSEAVSPAALDSTGTVENGGADSASNQTTVQTSESGKTAQAISVKVKAKSYKASALKKKAKTFKLGAAAKSKLTYKSSNKKYVKVSASGKVTIKKGTPKGVYRITIKAAAGKGYKKASRVVKITVK